MIGIYDTLLTTEKNGMLTKIEDSFRRGNTNCISQYCCGKWLFEYDITQREAMAERRLLIFLMSWGY